MNESTVGAGTGAMTASAGTVTIQAARLNCAATFGGAATVTATESYFANTLTFADQQLLPFIAHPLLQVQMQQSVRVLLLLLKYINQQLILELIL